MKKKIACLAFAFTLSALPSCNRNEDNAGKAVKEEAIPAVDPEPTPPMPERIDTLLSDTAVKSVGDSTAAPPADTTATATTSM